MWRNAKGGVYDIEDTYTMFIDNTLIYGELRRKIFSLSVGGLAKNN